MNQIQARTANVRGRQMPLTAEDLFKQGVRLHGEGDIESAEAAYRAALDIDPEHLNATYLLGLAASQTSRPALARDCLQQYVAQCPQDMQALSILAVACHDLCDYEQAEKLLVRAIAGGMDSSAVHFNLGKVRQMLGKLDAAVRDFDEAIRRDPAHIDAYISRALVLRSAEAWEDAAATLEHAILLAPYHAELHFHYGNVMHDLQDRRAAIDAYETALALKPTHIEAAVNCGNAYRELDDIEQALAHYTRALALAPEHPEARYNKSLALLADGQLSRGWRMYEARLDSELTRQKFMGHRPIRVAKEWDGLPIAGSLLVIAEQGLGDQIFFAGMLHDLQDKAGSITVCVDARLIPLLSRSYPQMRFVTPDALAADDHFEAQVYLGSLGRFLRPDTNALGNIRAAYLKADPQRAAELRSRIKRPGTISCGLTWRSGNPDQGLHKSLSLDQLAQALCLPTLDLVDLQYGPTDAERAEFYAQHGKSVMHLDEIDNFSDLDGLAALIDACDVVLSVSNTTAHLAAALGKPVIVMLPKSTGLFWYWHRDSDRSPWYPTAHLFRQSRHGDWHEVIDAVTLTLAGVV